MAASETNGSAALRAEVAGSRHGDAGLRAALMQRIERGARDDLAFLLSALADIDEPKVLQHLATKTLDDERPLGGEAGGRRLCDAAVDAFAVRLGLAKPSAASGTYGPEQRDAIRKEMRAKLPM